ncbi:MAG TPA: glycosyltransferase family 39 protein [Thermoleophilaceae bacterium]|jgi:hypothetical protein
MAGVVVMALGLALVAAPALLVPALLGVRGTVARVLAALVVGAADVVLVGTLVSFTDGFERPWLLADHAVLAALAYFWWRRAGRPAPFEGPPPRAIAASLRAGAREHPIVAVAVGAVAVALAIQLFLGLMVAQNNWDVMSYHLARAAYWLQYDSVSHFPGGSPRQIGYPPNTELLQAWTMELWGSDRLVALVQWLSGIGAALACYLAARFLGFERSGSALAGALLLAMPIPILQTTTAQNDLAAAFLVLATAAFLARGLRDGHAGELVVAGAALGLAVGTKNTAVMAIPSLALIAAAVAYRSRPARRTLAIAGAAAAIGIAALGSYTYVSNLRNTSSLTAHASDHLERSSPVKKNEVMIWWGFVDFPGVHVPWLDGILKSTVPDVLGDQNEQFYYAIDSGPDDSRSAFGPVGLLFLLPLLLAFALRPRTSPERRAFAIGALGLALLVPLFVEWNADITRVVVPAVALGAPLLAAIRSRELRTLAVLLSLAALAACVISNHNRMLINPGPPPVTWREDRIGELTANRVEMGPVLQRLREGFGETTPLGFAGRDDSWDYPLFGARHQRRVVRIRPLDVSADRLRAEGLTAVLFADVAPPANTGLQLEGLGPGFTLGRVPGG